MTDKKTASPLNFPIKSEQLVPHRPPMLLVDWLVEREGDRARSQAVLPESGICYKSKSLLTEFFIELIAQTSAMASGYDSLIAGNKPRDGMLVGVDSFKLYALGSPGSKLRIEADKKIEFGPVTLIHGKVWADKELLAEGDIKVWENLGDGSGK